MSWTKQRIGKLEVNVYDGEIEIEGINSEGEKENVAIDIERADQSHPLTPLGALYHIRLYIPQKETKNIPSEYDSVWIMGDGRMIKRGKECMEYQEKHPRIDR